MSNMEFWEKVKKPPEWALKKIKGGRLSGMTDISPQWRYLVLTENLGPCGVGWKYEINALWLEDGAENQKCAFAKILFYYKVNGEWSEPIPGIGGSMLVAKEKAGPYTSDEAYKMAVTDALSVALKMIGIGSDIYLGNMDGSKNRSASDKKDTPVSPLPKILAKIEVFDNIDKFRSYVENQWPNVEYALKDFPEDLKTAVKAMVDKQTILSDDDVPF